MISSKTTVTLSRVELRVARITQGQHVAVVASPSRPRFGVVSVGLQGPVGTVAENVLARAEAAELAATDAAAVAGQTASDLASLTNKLKDAFVYHAGAISAQGG